MPYLETPSMAPQARTNQELFFEKLNRDLDDAKNLLPNNITDINRANVAAANGVHARVALYSGNWQAAELYASNYINTPGLQLATLATFPGIWTDANNAEQAFRTVRTSAMTSPTTSPSLPARIGSLYRNTSASGANIGTVIWTVSDKLYDSYAANDIRRSSYFKTDATLAAANRPNPTRPGLIISKYAGAAYGTANENVANAKVMRTAEMYLIRAEARAQQDRFTGVNSAESDLNALRTNRIPAYPGVVLASKDHALEEILSERFKELAFEGHRFWDLKRTGRSITRLPSDALSAASQTLPADDYRFALPIPRTELQANRLMEQNPNY
jgi:starch-binding outer membrane protein, SusD/RagB family